MANEGDRWKSEEVAETKDAILLLISGKRKCGKDFISQLVHDRYCFECLYLTSADKRKFFCISRPVSSDNMLHVF